MPGQINKLLITMLLIVPALCCAPLNGVDRTISEPAADGGWTVMVWLDGDNNLENSALQDLNEMEYGLYNAMQTDSAVTDKVKIIVQVDRYTGSSTAYTGSAWSETRRYIVRPDPANNLSWTSGRIDNDLGEVNMGDARELRDFIEYCHTYFPADNYALILWNHGSGLRKKSAADFLTEEGAASSGTAPEYAYKAICIDETDGGDILYTGEITDVLTDAQSVRFMGFDACLMGMIEVAYEYRPGVAGKFGAEALCFSPASEQSDGWDYVRILTRLGGADSDADTADEENDPCYDASSPELTGQVFAALCAKEYGDEYSSYADNLQTQTAVDNTRVAGVKSAMDEFAAAIAAVSGYKSIVESIRGSGASTSTMCYFDDTSPSEWKSWPSFDLYDFAERVYGSASMNSVDDEAADLMNAIKSFILLSSGGSSYSGFTPGENGLSFFFTDGDAKDDSGNYYLQYQWWYTSVETDSVKPGYYYGKIDFCQKGLNNGIVENWYELIMSMYMASTGLTGSSFWPKPAY